MAELYRMENPNSRSEGAVLVRFPSGYACTASWKSQFPVADSLALAKACGVQIVEQLMATHHHADLNATNLVSLVAGIQRHVADWSDKLRAEQRLEDGRLQLADGGQGPGHC